MFFFPEKIKSCLKGQKYAGLGMKKMRLLLGVLCWLGLSQAGYAQRERGTFIKTPEIKPRQEKKAEPTPDSKNLLAVPPVQSGSPFEPRKPQNSLLSNFDTTFIDDKTLPLPLEMEEQILDDTSGVWVTTHRYYAIWDPVSIDPYNIPPETFTDPVDLTLYDRARNQLWAAPLEVGVPTSAFGWRWNRWHTGIDLDLNTGTPVFAMFDGIVRVVGYDGSGYGRYVMVRHYNGLETLYAHLSVQTVNSGQYIKAGDLLGLGGSTGRSTGAHLHFEIRYEGNPFSPTEVFAWPENQIKTDHYLLTPHVWDYLRSKQKIQFEYKAAEKSVQSRRVSWYKVRPGDSLYEIADRAGTSVQQLKKLNSLRSNTIQAGKRLRIK